MPLPRLLGSGFDVLGADERTHGDDEEQGDNAVEPEGFLLAGGGGAHGVPSLGARVGTLLSVPFGLRRRCRVGLVCARYGDTCRAQYTVTRCSCCSYSVRLLWLVRSD